MAVITTPVTEPNDIQKEINLSGVTNYRNIMLASTINKYAKCKPINHTSLHKLTDTERKGLSTDIKDGIVYGVQCGCAKGKLSQIHNADWSYVRRPTGDINTFPFRPWDFVGYDKNAQPTLKGGGLSDKAIIDRDDNGLNPQLYWNRSGNTTGIDLAEALSGISTTLNYSDLYLCIMIGTMATAMLNVTDGTEAVRPILYNSVEGNKFKCPALPDSLKTKATRQVTFFLLSSSDVTNIGLNGSWKNVSGDPYNTSCVPVTVPELVNLSILFKKMFEVISSLSVTLTALTSDYSINPSFVKDVDWNNVEYKYMEYVLTQDGVSQNFRKVVEVDSAGNFLGVTLKTLISDSGLVYNPGETHTYKVTVYFKFKQRTTDEVEYTALYATSNQVTL